MKKIFLLLPFLALLCGAGKDGQKDPFLAMQWVLKDPKGVVKPYTKKFTKNGKEYFYLPETFWADTTYKVVLVQEVVKSKFLSLYKNEALWFEQTSGISREVYELKALRESWCATTWLCVATNGQPFGIKQSKFNLALPESLGFRDTVGYQDDSHKDGFIRVKNARHASQLFLLTVTQDHYVERLSGGKKFFNDPGNSLVQNWRKGNFAKHASSMKYPADIFIKCLCGYKKNNWATDCHNDEKWLERVREIKKKK